MRRSARRELASRRPSPNLASLMAAAALLGCHAAEKVLARSPGPTSGGCYSYCSGPFEIPAPPLRKTPVAVAGGQTFTVISAGFHHACALTPAGTAQCWGELDVGTNMYRMVP